MKQVTTLQGDLEVVLREFIPLKHEAAPLDEAIGLDKFLKKIKVTLKPLISTDQKWMELMEIDKDDDTNSNNSGPAKAKAATSIKLPKLNISKFDRDVLNGRTLKSSSESQFTADTSIPERHPERWSCRARHSRATTDSRHLRRRHRVSVKQVWLVALDTPGSRSCHYRCSIFKRGQRERNQMIACCTLATLSSTQSHGLGAFWDIAHGHHIG